MVAERIGVSKPLVSHYENGRVNIPPKRFRSILQVYQYSDTEFTEHLEGKPLSEKGSKEECVHLLDQIDDQKMQAVHAVLMSFVRS